MPRVLVVDDSKIDRRLVEGLLAADESLSCEFACDGEEALQAIEADRPDLVITDLMMPKLDGLELVARIRRDHPLVPVVLMTSKGSEQTAVRALKAGAASYTPKKRLPEDLLETVHNVLAVSHREQSSARLYACLTACESRFELENDSSLIPSLVEQLQDDAQRVGVCDREDRVRLGVALDEALINAMYHGNLEIPSELRDSDEAACAALIEERLHCLPYCERQVRVEVRMQPLEAVFLVRDEGAGFDHRQVAASIDASAVDRVGGRGLLLMRTFMDEIQFLGAGNEVKMIKRRTA